MKNKLIVTLIFVMIVSVFITGCGKVEKKNKEAVNTSIENIQSDDNNASVPTSSSDIPISKEITAAAKEEGVSTSEMQKMLDDLAQMGADKYGISKDDYIKQIEGSGNTVLSEWKVAADYMGLSIKELYEYEKANAGNMTDEQKDMMGNLADAVKMAEEVLENMPEDGTTAVENILGIHGNNSGEIREVTIDTKEAFAYKVDEILQDYEDDYSIVFEYISDVDVDDLENYYDEIVLNTEGYMKLDQPGALGAMLQGTVNGIVVYIEIDGEVENGVRVSTYLDLTTKK